MLANGTLVLTESEHGWSVERDGADISRSVLPATRPAGNPRFNPLLCRRLLRAFFRLRAAKRRRIALFGTGGHSEELLQWGFPDDLTLTIAVASDPAGNDFQGLPVVCPAQLDHRVIDAVLLSSVTYEAEMLEAVQQLAPRVPAVPLYSDWPPDFWNA